ARPPCARRTCLATIASATSGSCVCSVGLEGSVPALGRVGGGLEVGGQGGQRRGGRRDLLGGGRHLAAGVGELLHGLGHLAGGRALLLGGEAHLGGGVGDGFEQRQAALHLLGALLHGHDGGVGLRVHALDDGGDVRGRGLGALGQAAHLL